MHRLLSLTVLAILTAFSLPTMTTHAAVVTEKIEYTVGKTKLVGILAYDDTISARRPGVLVCHEWWGRNAYAESRAKMLAAQGYVAFALDMYGEGRTTEDAKKAGELASSVMSDPSILRDRAAAGLKVLAEHPRTDPANLAAIGYCMGGTVALELARSGARYTQNLKAVVAFHASTIAAKNPDENSNITGTVLICHGAIDNFVQPDQIPAFNKQMADAKIDFIFISYAGAKHAFTNPGADKHKDLGVAYNKPADERSWKHMLDLFNEKFPIAKP